MASPEQLSVSDAELEVLKVLWQHGPTTVREVAQTLSRRRKKWAYTTVLTLLSRLRDKRYVSQSKPDIGTAHVFAAAITRQQLLGQQLTELADRVCDGTASPLVQALVNSRQLKPDDIAQLRQMLKDLEEKE